MACKLKLVQTQDKSIFTPYGIFSILLLLVAIYLIFKDKSTLPPSLKNIPFFVIDLFCGLCFINGFYAILRGSLTKPDDIGTLSVDETLQKIIIELESGKHEINFPDINRVDFDIKGYKSLTDNVHGNKNFVEIFYNLSMQRERYEFIIESPSDMYIFKNAFGSIRHANPRVMINY